MYVNKIFLFNLKYVILELNAFFEGTEIKVKIWSRFTEWIYKSTEDLSISLLIYKIER